VQRYGHIQPAKDQWCIGIKGAASPLLIILGFRIVIRDTCTYATFVPGNESSQVWKFHESCGRPCTLPH